MIAVAVSCSAVAVIAAGILFTVLFAIPFSKYKKASSMLEEGKYDAGIQIFANLTAFCRVKKNQTRRFTAKQKN